MEHSSQPSEDTGDAARALPQRHGVPDCLYYSRTGRCDYGINCRFNHPPKGLGVLEAALEKRDGYPERVGQTECQFYLKTGTCKFGSTCRYHHPREKAGILGKSMANTAGYPLRLGEKDCAYYRQTGTCRFGMLCKFNHPHPACSLSTIVAGTRPPSAFSSGSLVKEPYMQGLPLHNSCYAPFLVQHNGLISMPGWTAYQGLMRPVVPISHLHMKQHTFEATAMYGAASRSTHASYSPYMVGSAATGLEHSSNLYKDSSNFPERPGQPECKYYVKTGDCKFGASCHFDHPKRWILPRPDFGLSSQGLPERPGTQPCGYYMQYGTCKFGIACRFDHPTASLTYSPFPKALLNFHSLPYSQNFTFPNFANSSMNTLGETNVQQCNKGNETSLVDEQQPLASKALEIGVVLRDSSNEGETKAST